MHHRKKKFSCHGNKEEHRKKHHGHRGHGKHGKVLSRKKTRNDSDVGGYLQTVQNHSDFPTSDGRQTQTDRQYLGERLISEDLMTPQTGHNNHTGYKAYVNLEQCVACGKCERRCQAGAISVGNGSVQVDMLLCTGCGQCVDSCKKRAITLVEEKEAAVA